MAGGSCGVFEVRAIPHGIPATSWPGPPEQVRRCPVQKGRTRCMAWIPAGLGRSSRIKARNGARALRYRMNSHSSHGVGGVARTRLPWVRGYPAHTMRAGGPHTRVRFEFAHFARHRRGCARLEKERPALKTRPWEAANMTGWVEEEYFIYESICYRKFHRYEPPARTCGRRLLFSSRYPLVPEIPPTLPRSRPTSGSSPEPMSFEEVCGNAPSGAGGRRVVPVEQPRRDGRHGEADHH